jgi:hypothetical protein
MDENKNELNDPKLSNSKASIRIFHSFKEQEEYELRELIKLSPIEILQQLRKFINIAYGMHGFDPKNLPVRHTIRILTPQKT